MENRHLNRPADTAWYNLGDWSGDDETYPEACERLAGRLAAGAGFRPGQSLFDIGCGCAEQDLFWLRTFGLSSVDAITLPGPQLDFAKERLESEGVSPRIHVTGLALEDLRPKGVYDHVVALDSAYHFSKSVLFARAAALTTRGSHLAFTDLVPARPHLERTTRRMLRAGGVDPDHLETQVDLDTRAGRSGFELRSSENLSAEVMRGFSEFVRARRIGLMKSAGVDALRFIVTGWGLGQLYRQGSLTYRLLVYART